MLLNVCPHLEHTRPVSLSSQSGLKPAEEKTLAIVSHDESYCLSPSAAGTGLGSAGILDRADGGTTAVGLEPEWMMEGHLSPWLLWPESKVGKTVGSNVGVDLELVLEV